MKAKKEINTEFSDEFYATVGLIKSIMTHEPAETGSLRDLILSIRDNLKDLRKRGYMTQEHAQHVFDEFLISLDIYKRLNILLGLFLDPLRVQKRPFKKDVISTIIWWFGLRLENYYRTLEAHPDDFPEIAELISRPGGYWGAMEELFSEAGLVKADNEGYTAQELKRQYDRLKNTKFYVICKDRYLAYLFVCSAFHLNPANRPSDLAAELSKLFPL